MLQGSGPPHSGLAELSPKVCKSCSTVITATAPECLHSITGWQLIGPLCQCLYLVNVHSTVMWHVPVTAAGTACTTPWFLKALFRTQYNSQRSEGIDRAYKSALERYLWSIQTSKTRGNENPASLAALWTHLVTHLFVWLCFKYKWMYCRHNFTGK